MARGPGRIGVTELLVGLPFPAAALEVMRFAVRPERFQEIIYEGRTYAPEDARLCGLVDEVADEVAVVERACQVAETLAAIPPPSFALSKRHIRQPVRDLLDAHEASIDAEVMRVWTNPETRDAVRRYVERVLGARA